MNYGLGVVSLSEFVCWKVCHSEAMARDNVTFKKWSMGKGESPEWMCAVDMGLATSRTPHPHPVLQLHEGGKTFPDEAQRDGRAFFRGLSIDVDSVCRKCLMWQPPTETAPTEIS